MHVYVVVHVYTAKIVEHCNYLSLHLHCVCEGGHTALAEHAWYLNSRGRSLLSQCSQKFVALVEKLFVSIL